MPGEAGPSLEGPHPDGGRMRARSPFRLRRPPGGGSGHGAAGPGVSRVPGSSLLLALLLAGPACFPAEVPPDVIREGPAAAVESTVRPEGDGSWPAPDDSIPGTPWTREDWEIFSRTLQTAEATGLDTLPAGEAVAGMGLLFLDTPYLPRTLEVPGPERLVVNFRALDCVTFVENVLALTRFHRRHGVAALLDPAEARADYEALLREIRYRDGRVAGYASRLHYFSEWILENTAAGRLENVTAELGGVPDPEPVDFMSTHADAYPQLSDPEVARAVARVEADLAGRGPRLFIPESDLGEASEGIRTGDVIAATSTVPGLDVAHTGIAVRRDGRLHLLHAPLVGESVTLSERPLARRIQEIPSQDGIMVARPSAEWLDPQTGNER